MASKIKKALATSIVSLTLVSSAQAQETTNPNKKLVNLAFTASANASNVINDTLNNNVFKKAFPRRSFRQAAPQEKTSLCKHRTGIGQALFNLPYQTKEQRGVILSSPLSPTFTLTDQLKTASICADEALKAYTELGEIGYVKQDAKKLDARSAQICVNGSKLIPGHFSNVDACKTFYQATKKTSAANYKNEIADFTYYKETIASYQKDLNKAGITFTHE